MDFSSGNKAKLLYGDIIGLPRPVSRTKRPMARIDRAAQFSSFSALTGYEEAVKETARLTAERRKPDEERQEQINRTLRLLSENAAALPLVHVVYFERDKRKSGGEYVTAKGRFRRIDEESLTVVFTDGSRVSIGDILEISCNTDN